MPIRYKIDDSISSDENSDNETIDRLDRESSKNIRDSLGNPKKSFCKRLLGPIKEGSLRAHIFILATVALGISSLSMPKALHILGIIPGTLLFLLIAFLCYRTLKILGRVSSLSQTYDLSELVKKNFGKKCQTAYDIIAMLFLYGILVTQQVVAEVIVGILLYDIAYNHTDKIEDVNMFFQDIYTVEIRILVNLIIALFFFYPICLMSNISKFAWTSIVALVLLIYVILVR